MPLPAVYRVEWWPVEWANIQLYLPHGRQGFHLLGHPKSSRWLNHAWEEDVARNTWLEFGDEGDNFNVICKSRMAAFSWCFLQTPKAGSKDTLLTRPQTHKHKYGSCAGEGRYVRHTAQSGKIHLDYTVCKHSIFQFPLQIWENLIRTDLRHREEAWKRLSILSSSLVSHTILQP